MKQEWNPVEDAPPDGTECLVWRDNSGSLGIDVSASPFLPTTEVETLRMQGWMGIEMAYFARGEFLDENGYPVTPVTHWMPLPDPPVTPPQHHRDAD